MFNSKCFKLCLKSLCFLQGILAIVHLICIHLKRVLLTRAGVYPFFVPDTALNAWKARRSVENGMSLLRLGQLFGPILNRFSLRFKSLRCLKLFRRKGE